MNKAIRKKSLAYLKLWDKYHLVRTKFPFYRKYKLGKMVDHKQRTFGDPIHF